MDIRIVLILCFALVLIWVLNKHAKKKEQEEKNRENQAKKILEQHKKDLLQRQMEKEQEEKEAAERELRRKEYEELCAKWEKEFNEEIEAMPSAKIKLSSEKYSRRALSGMPEVKFTNITKRTNPLTFTSYVVVDVETTGIPRTSKIIELSAIRFEGFEPVEKFSTLVNPEREIPPEATKVNHITDDMVANAPKIWEVMPAFQRFVGASPIVGHNLAFDLQFLYANGFELNNPKQRFYDTLQLAKSVLKKAEDDYDIDCDVDDYKLGTLCEYYGIYQGKAHRACSDCLVTGKLFKNLAEEKME